jgi:hypothetical protein
MEHRKFPDKGLRKALTGMLMVFAMATGGT